jgi:mono/diheme cytochrome c family protein
MKRHLLCIGVLVTTLLVSPLARAASTTTAELWLDKCARCHGDTGSGDTPLGKKLKVVDYSSKKAQEVFTDEYLLKLIFEGKTVNNKVVMPGYKDEITAEEANHLVRYIRSLAK